VTFQPHALDVLEFSRVLDHIAGHAATIPGAARIRALRPSRVGGTRPGREASLDLLRQEREASLDALRTEHARVAAMRSLVASEAGWRSEPIPELADALARLRVAGTSWTGRELRDGVVLLRSTRRAQEALRDPSRHPAARAPLARYADALIARPALESRLEGVFNDEGELKDDASPELRKIRRELRGAEGELVRLLERIMSKLETHHRVDDGSVTLRNGRYVIPVRREGRVVLGGIVHDSSQSGQTLFVEPPAAVEAGNRIRELESDEKEEVERILLELTESLRPEREGLVAAYEALVELDSLYGRARYCIAAACADADLVAARDGFVVRGGRHPLLLAQGTAVIPFNLEMTPEERTLLVSGPNTGGKTVLLKALALIALMAQSGIPAPVAPESRIPCFDDIFADIGDEQSIAASLSTFSAHLKHLVEILEQASADALVLVDELGSGTDPLEGAALGGAILEELTRRGTTTIATTHLGALKELAGEVPGVVNASLQFDEERLAPTYRLTKGIPGRSYGLAIAQRLRMPANVLDRAVERVPRIERDLAALLADVEKRAAALTEREREVTTQQESLELRDAKATQREAELKSREREVERESRRDARRHLLDARREVERTIQALKAAGAANIDETAAESRRALEALAASEQSALDSINAAEQLAAAAAASEIAAAAAASGGAQGAPDVDERGVPLAIGDAVAVGTLGGKTGRLIERRGDDAVVAVGAMKLTVPFTSLRRLSSRHLREDRVEVAMIDVPEPEVRTEVDLRGLRVHEMDEAVVQAIDAAIRADLTSLRIIHGKGTGALRVKVTEILKRDRRVKQFRLGAWNEGGAGVTVAEFS
jgi:DNA mismatch repair protein MutS2